MAAPPTFAHYYCASLVKSYGCGMSRNVCSSRSRCRRLIGRTTLFALPLAISTGTVTAQSTIPFQPGLVLTYVMRNLSDTADRKSNSTICAGLIGGLPFMIEIGTDLLVVPALTSHHASATATHHFMYGGDLGLTPTSTGLLNTSSVAYIDMVRSGSIITSAGMLSRIPAGAGVPWGVEAKLLGLTIPILGTKKELGNHWRMIETEPKGYNCGT